MGYSGPPPSLNWVFEDFKDFTNGKPASATFTRATAGYAVAANGLLTSFSSGVLRHDFDPETGEYLGILIEESRTNHIVWCNDLTQTVWSKNGTATATAGASSDGPDGTSDYTRVTDLGAVASNHLYQVITSGLGASVRVEPVMWIRKISPTGSLRIEDASTGSGNGRWTVDFAALSSGWQRLDRNTTGVTINTEFMSNGSGAGGLNFYAVSGTLDFDIAFINVQPGSFPTSVIKTEGSTVTRNADVLTIPVADIDSVGGGEGVNASEGTLFVCGVLDWAFDGASFPTFASLNAGDSNNRIEIFRDATSYSIGVVVTSGGSNVYLPTALAYSPGTVAKIAVAYKANDFNAALDGTLFGADALGAVPSGLSELRIGGAAAGTNILNGHVLHIAYFPRRLSNANLQAITG